MRFLAASWKWLAVALATAAVACAPILAVLPAPAEARPLHPLAQGLTAAQGLPAAPGLPSGPVDSCVSTGKVWMFVVTDADQVLASTCAGRPSTGEEALTNAGLSFSHKPSAGYICIIGGYPKVCKTGFDGHYWSYWWATPGGHWTYSQEGAGTRAPPAGSIEAWCYTTAAPEAQQKATCIGQLNARINPRTISAVPSPSPPPSPPTSTRPPTSKPSASRPPATTRPRPGQPSTQPSSSGRQTSAHPSASATTSGSPSASITPSSQPSSAAPSSATPSSASPSSAHPSSGSTPPPSASASAADSSQPGAEQTVVTVPATVTDSGTPTGLIVTGSVLSLGGLTAGLLWWRRRQHLE